MIGLLDCFGLTQFQSLSMKMRKLPHNNLYKVSMILALHSVAALGEAIGDERLVHSIFSFEGMNEPFDIQEWEKLMSKSKKLYPVDE